MADYSAIGNYVYENFVLPSLGCGKDQITVQVADVWRGLKGRHGLVAIHTVLSSNRFRETYFLDQAQSPAPPNVLPVEYTFDLRRLRSLTTPRQSSLSPDQERQ